MVVLAGCGLRVGGSEVHAATQAAIGSGGGLQAGPQSVTASGTPGSGGSGGSSPGATSGGESGGVTPDGGAISSGSASASSTGGPTSGGSSGGSSGNTPAAGTTGATGAAGTSGAGGSSIAPPAPAGGNGGATDVGVTATSITVGNVSDVGGPVPGLFQGGPYGVQAYFDYINSLGGVYGRQLKLNAADDQLQCSQNEADYQNMVGSVFAFVGSWSLDDNCGAQILGQHPTIPVVNSTLSAQAEALRGAYSEQPYTRGAALGPLLYYKSKYPDAIKAVGTIVGNQPSAVQAWKNYEAAAQSIGYKFIYEDDFPPVSSNFTTDVIRMKSAGVKMVDILSVNAPDLAAFSQEAAQQGFHPELFVSGVGYFGAYIQEAGGPSAVEGQYVAIGQARFLGEDAGSVPEVALFDQWMHTAFPNFPIDQFASTSWANAALFVQALVTAGPHPTRQAVVSALANTHSFDDHGLMAPIDVGSKNPTNCYIIMQIHGGKFERVDDPPTGYRCDAPFFKVG